MQRTVCVTTWLALSIIVAGTRLNAAEVLLVADGRPNAEIVIASAPTRLVKLAAEELRTYVKKMTGAELSVVTNVTDAIAVKLYVGPSAYTDRLGITNEGLEHGAYRLRSGPDYLVMLGHELEFEPPVPAIFGKGHGARERAQAAWDEMTRDRTDSAWGNPHGSLHRSYNAAMDIWHHDQSGSLNAVYDFLRMQGVRWYMPGELGEVVPRRASLALPEVDKVVVPDFPVRRFFTAAFFVMSPPDLLWHARLGLNHGYPLLAAKGHVHGMRTLVSRSEMKEKHPEYFALVGGQRNTAGHVCYSSEGFTREAIAYVRAVFDLLDEPVVDLWPNDGIRVCECDECSGHSRSDLVFGFLDRVAREVNKTHPDKLVTSGAYSSYRLPPREIETFSPNVGITIAFPRPGLDQPETWGGVLERTYDELIFGWRDKVPSGHILGNSNFRGPLLITRSIAADLRARKGRSVGDWNEVGHLSRVGDTRGGRAVGRQTWKLGLHHLNVYVNARLLWDADRDLDALLDEYFEFFYGPVAETVQDVFTFIENNYTRGQGRPRLELDQWIHVIETLQEARERAGDTVYGRRIGYILEEEKSLDELREQKAAADAIDEVRGRARLAIGRDDDAQEPPTHALVNLVTGEEPEIDTTFQVTWNDGTLVFDFRCEEPDMENLFVTQDVWGGDSVAILLETPFHAYYQMEINPDGKMAEADRQYGLINQKWKSLAKVDTERGEDYWRVVVRIPVVDEATGALDPNHNVVGSKPTRDAPWFLQVGRVRIRDFDKTAYGFTQTGRTYHDRQKFGRLVIE